MNYVHVDEGGKSVCFLWVPNNTERRKKQRKNFQSFLIYSHRV